MNIDVSAYFGSSLLDRALLGTFQQILKEHCPIWSRELRLWEAKERAPKIDLADPLTVYDAIEFDVTTHAPFYLELLQRFGPPRDPRTCGTLEFRGADDSITIVMAVDEHRFWKCGDIWTWGNDVAFQLRRTRIEGQEGAQFARQLLEDICAHLDPWYARAESSEEFEAKNISHAGGGVEAIGVDTSKSLPGLYWLNYFAGPCIDVMGENNFLACEAFENKKIKSGYLLTLGEHPRDWANADYAATERHVMKTLGEQFFFQRDAPSRATRSPFAMSE